MDRADTPLRSLLRKRWVHNWVTILAFLSLSATLFRPQWTFGHEALNHSLDLVGLALVFLGIFIRLCARGRKYDTPGRGITMDGVYAYLRHPLYFASFTLGLGLCVVVGSFWITLLYVVCFWATHGPVLLSEERFLRKTWPKRHRKYCQQVPALIPSLGAMRRREPILPQRPWVAILKEADALCLWPAVAYGLMIWEDLSVDPHLQHRLVEVCVLAGLMFGCGLLWLFLKREWTVKRHIWVVD